MKKFLCIILIGFLIYILPKENLVFTKSDTPSTIVYMTLKESKDIVELDIEEYLKGVIFAEMPSSFSAEALKAQAVASRTYTLKKLSSGDHICNDPSHCQAWEDPTNSKDYEKISEAVLKTASEQLTYLGEPIEAFFHSSSGGKTENSEDVWDSKRPYLTSVDSPGEEKIMDNFYTSKEISYKELAEKINTYKNKDLITTTSLKNKIKILSRTDGNHVKEIKVQNTTLSGTELRAILDLRSSNFDIKLTDKTIIFNVSGYGHGVGMSQWGAEVMAQNGSTYQEILYHYYPGTIIDTI